VALLLRSRGIQRIRPLAGGLQAWRDAGFPVEAADRKESDAEIDPNDAKAGLL
jgi:3-mercaptopyruvate sulfurtransferase SseA